MMRQTCRNQIVPLYREVLIVRVRIVPLYREVVQQIRTKMKRRRKVRISVLSKKILTIIFVRIFL